MTDKILSNGLIILYQLLQCHRKIDLCIVNGASSWNPRVLPVMTNDIWKDIGRASVIATLLNIDNFKLEVIEE